MVYMSENKATVLALVATGAGAVTALDEDTRSTIQKELGQGSSGLVLAVGVFGAGYCLFNLDECTSVSARLAAHATETNAIKTRAQQISSQLAELKQSVQQHQSQVQSLTQQLQESESAIGVSQQRMAELRCKGPFC